MELQGFRRRHGERRARVGDTLVSVPETVPVWTSNARPSGRSGVIRKEDAGDVQPLGTLHAKRYMAEYLVADDVGSGRQSHAEDTNTALACWSLIR
jgi:hypothetical protein